MSKKSLPDYDIAIIGGGASGIYTAWRMLLEGPEHSAKIKKWVKARGSLRIAVFEGSQRIGGRLLTAKSPGLPNIVCEIGGMRYVSSQTLVRSLVEKKFDLPTHQQDVVEDNNLVVLRGKTLHVKDLSSPEKLPYNLTSEEKEWLNKKIKEPNTASDFLGYAVQKIFPNISKYHGPALRTYLNKQKFNGIPLYKHGFWNLVATQLSHEAYSIAVTTVGYDCLGFNTNAVDAICEYFDFAPGVTYNLFDNGFDSLIWMMQSEFQKGGGEVELGCWLESFDKVSLPDRSSGISLQFKGMKKPKTARSIVLAMPKRSLELLEQKGPVLDPKKAPHVRHLMNAVEPIHLYKMFRAYDHPWWEKKGVTEGRSLTDTPVRQCYYWGVESKQPNGDKKNNNALLMVYNDALSSDFWGGLRNIPLGPGDTKTESSTVFKRKYNASKNTGASEWDKRLHQNWKNAEVPKAMVAEMHRQVKIMHGMENAPEPFDAAFMDWADDPFGGAVHFWNPGYRSIEVMNAIVQPVENVPCYICGEAYSTNQTWVEGALQTAEILLRKFDIPEPKWLIKK
jgi:Flavin containing amine oxidoreductase